MWPGIDAELIQKHLNPTFNTAQEHMKYIKHGLQTTDSSETHKLYDILEHHRCKHMYIKITKVCGHIYGDQTGRFFVHLSCSNKYILNLYNVDSTNMILRPLKTRRSHDIITVILEVLTLCIANSYHPKIY